MNLTQAEAMRDRIQGAMQRAGGDESRFGPIAAEALAATRLDAADFSLEALAEWVGKPGGLVDPGDAASPFGDLPLTLARGNGFSIQLLLWTVGSTAIHTHSFSGAFTVLKGSSLHTLYQMETRQRLSAGGRWVRCAVDGVERLEVGDVRVIESGERMVHSTFHVDEPTLSLVVRTDHEPWSGPQLLIVPPDLAISVEWLRRDARVQMVEKALRAMKTLDDARLEAAFDRAIEQLDLPRVCLLLRSCYGLIYGPPRDRLLERIKKIHGEPAAKLPEAVRRLEHGALIKDLRAHTEEPAARRILAALLVAEDRRHFTTILDLFRIGPDVLEHWATEIPAIRKLQPEGAR